MRQIRWVISVWVILCLVVVKGKGERLEVDTIPLPLRSYSIGKEVDSILGSSSLSTFLLN